MNGALVLLAIMLAAVSGVPGALLSRRSAAGERIAAALLVSAAVCGLTGAFGIATSAAPEVAAVPWHVPGGVLAMRLDAIAGMFLAQIFLIAPLVSVYGLSYWPQAEHPQNGRKVRLFHGLLTASMAVLVVADNAILFLLGWESMALAAFLLLTTEDQDPAVRESGFVYFVATRIGTLSLFAMFALLHYASGSWAFRAPGAIAPGLRDAIFVLALVGCGLKAGVMPMHVWLPGAHANAPSHVSAFMSGVLIKMGIYGLVRVCSFFEHPPMLWGLTVLGLGALSGVFGVAFAIAQHDLKRLLAYHSVENIGIILMGLGVALIGRTLGRADLVALGLAGSLLHVWNHGLFKALLFFSAGAVVHATHTREIDALGGLARKMPKTALAFLVGAVAISGLPPFNGFVSELFVYMGLFRATLAQDSGAWVASAFGIPALALIGALALACFAKVFGAVFLGAPRTERGRDAHEPGRSMTTPMLVLGVLCAFIGLAPLAVAPVLDSAISTWAPELMRAAPSVRTLAPLGWLSATGVALVALTALGAAIFARLARPSRALDSVTWDCGYVAPTARMQYTASSFAGTLVGLFAWALRPDRHAEETGGLFATARRFHTHVPDTVLDRAVLPALRAVGRGLGWFRWVQQGNVQLYLLYVVLAVIITLLLRR